jgi:hypothetical protein
MLDALRCEPGALAFSATPAAWRRVAAETRTSPLSQERIMAAFAAVPSTPRASWGSLPRGLDRLCAPDANRFDFPLRRICASRDSSLVDVGRFTGDGDAKPFNAAAAKQDLAERLPESFGDAFSAAAWLAGAAGNLVADTPPGDARLDELASRLGWAVIAIIRAGGVRPAEPPAAAEGDKLVPIATAAQILGVSKNAALKRARKKGFVELVGKRVHIRRGLIDALYETRAALA